MNKDIWLNIKVRDDDIFHRLNAYVLGYRLKLAGDQPQDLNTKMCDQNTGNIRLKKKEKEILGFCYQSAQNTRSITFHGIYNRNTILDWKLK